MKIVGAVAEFNPFHKGHMYFINAIRSEIAPDGIVCIMSGDFTQRGFPAVCDKWARAKAALACGCDLVVELPAVFCLSSASDFAYGGIKILKSLGTTDIAFGSETGESDELVRLASVNTENNQEVKEAMAKGLSYPKALA
ncbi:MAG: nucleotidyltransferase family protein, partial [Firmicutes bacterium]|nr:nucleotidyltransferase family protein [Bacillota bacterium]